MEKDADGFYTGPCEYVRLLQAFSFPIHVQATQSEAPENVTPAAATSSTPPEAGKIHESRERRTLHLYPLLSCGGLEGQTDLIKSNFEVSVRLYASTTVVSRLTSTLGHFSRSASRPQFSFVQR